MKTTDRTVVKCTLNGRWEMFLPPHRANRPEWYTEKGWEKERLESIHDHITENDLMFYVGAEEGDMPALIQMWGAKMVLFEPNPLVWSNIKLIYEANGLETPWCWCGFVGSRHRPGTFAKEFPPSADGPIITDHGFKELAYQSGEFPQTTIDEVVGKTKLIPTALSIDVEGSEGEVLGGAKRTLELFHPKIWLSLHPEFLYRMFRVYSGDLRSWLKRFGYKETLLAYDHEVHLFYE